MGFLEKTIEGTVNTVEKIKLYSGDGYLTLYSVYEHKRNISHHLGIVSSRKTNPFPLRPGNEVLCTFSKFISKDGENQWNLLLSASSEMNESGSSGYYYGKKRFTPIKDFLDYYF